MLCELATPITDKFLGYDFAVKYRTANTLHPDDLWITPSKLTHFLHNQVETRNRTVSRHREQI